SGFRMLVAAGYRNGGCKNARRSRLAASHAAGPVADGRIGPDADSRSLRGDDEYGRESRRNHRRTEHGVRRDGKTPHGGTISRTGRGLFPERTIARFERVPLALLSRALVPHAGRPDQVEIVLRASPRASPRRCGRARLAWQRLSPARTAGSGRDAVCEGLVARTQIGVGPLRSRACGARTTRPAPRGDVSRRSLEDRP